MYGYQTEKAFLEFFEIDLIERIKLEIPLNFRMVKYVFDNYNFVIGGGHYVSVHLVGGETIGYMVYLDDNYNIDLMIYSSIDIVNDVEISAGVKYEGSLDADTSSSMTGEANGISFGTGIKNYMGV